MKTITNLTLFVVIAAIAASCSTVTGEKTKSAPPAEAKTTSYDKVFVLTPEKSLLAWEGYKPTGQHHGTVSISNGNLMINDGNITGGKFTMDMNSITVEDLTDPEWNGKLTGHLKSPDFFEVSTYPQASFEITAVQPVDASAIDKSKEKGDIVPTHAITGNLTMKGITKSITFHARVNKSDDMIMAESNMFFIDRTEWNVQYKSKKISAKFKDDFINDEMGIKLMVAFTPGNQVASL